jgi:hypothetical protein
LQNNTEFPEQNVVLPPAVIEAVGDAPKLTAVIVEVELQEDEFVTIT